MRKHLLFLFFFLSSCCIAANAQCNLHPFVMPDNLVLCPNTFDTLYVTKEFDSYQWFKFNKAIPGAMQRYLVVNAQNDAGDLFKVQVTKNGCVDTSKKVLVDGYVFASPIVITNGTPSYCDINTNTSIYCRYDSVSLTFADPYNTNVQWYNNRMPIAGATKQTYEVTGNGSYTVCGSPEICPAFTTCENIPINIAIDESTTVITRNGDTLFASKGKNYQWFINGTEIPGATSFYYFPTKKGLYTVQVADKFNCTSTSKPLLFIPTKNLIAISPNPAYSFITVHFNLDNAAQVIISDIFGNQRLQVVVNSNQNIQVNNLSAGTYILHLLDSKGNIIASEKFMKK